MSRSNTDVNSASFLQSLLVETVNIKTEEFAESFLTCTTCVSPFDSASHSPKLLPCSHTVCRSCLERLIAMGQEQGLGGTSQQPQPDMPSFRCPICRETIAIPSGASASAFAPSFLVNQLMDLLKSQEPCLLPCCPIHGRSQNGAEMMFCEDCQRSFCIQCTRVCPRSGSGSCTVVPLGIALKRMCAIGVFKTSQCQGVLQRAAENVRHEMDLLDDSVAAVTKEIEHTFQVVRRLLDDRQSELMAGLARLREEKRKALLGQLGRIEVENGRLDAAAHFFHNSQQHDISHVSQKLSILDVTYKEGYNLSEPRENAFIQFQSSNCDLIESTSPRSGSRRFCDSALVGDVVRHFGALRVSHTFPSLCPAALICPPALARLPVRVCLTAMDSSGQRVDTCGDPVTASVTAVEKDVDDAESTSYSTEVDIRDFKNGCYLLSFCPLKPGLYELNIRIFGRPIKTYPFPIDVLPHQTPVWMFGSSNLGGSGNQINSGSSLIEHVVSTDPQPLYQPIAVASSPDGKLYILDSGNDRIKIVNMLENRDSQRAIPLGGSSLSLSSGSFQHHDHSRAVDTAFETGEAGHLSSGSGVMSWKSGATGMAIMPDNLSLLVVSWRSKTVSQIRIRDGVQVKSFTLSEFVEPVAISVDSAGHVLVADNARCRVYIFRINSPQQPSENNSVTANGNSSTSANPFGGGLVNSAPAQLVRSFVLTMTNQPGGASQSTSVSAPSVFVSATESDFDRPRDSHRSEAATLSAGVRTRTDSAQPACVVSTNRHSLSTSKPSGQATSTTPLLISSLACLGNCVDKARAAIIAVAIGSDVRILDGSGTWLGQIRGGPSRLVSGLDMQPVGHWDIGQCNDSSGTCGSLIFSQPLECRILVAHCDRQRSGVNVYRMQISQGQDRESNSIDGGRASAELQNPPGSHQSSTQERPVLTCAIQSIHQELSIDGTAKDAKLRRPSGLCVEKSPPGSREHRWMTGSPMAMGSEPDDRNGHFFVADLGNHCVKKFRFK